MEKARAAVIPIPVFVKEYDFPDCMRLHISDPKIYIPKAKIT